MAANHLVEKQQAVEAAHQVLQGWPITPEEFGRAVERVLKADPPVTGKALVELIVQEGLAEWMSGTGYV
jgi:hypothetical protein